ncbi:MAG: large conductance mechanosensitive channel protein MscL [Lachnospiraceae bacterium]|nr:large conductance mechanosensitive channel protein MscL [Lachnospiraceae bacterium]
MATEVKKKTKGFFGEFREFISKGSVMDMAVGIIIGGAFQAIINSLVNDILMPLIGMIIKTESLADLKVMVGTAEITYGAFIAAIINFLLMALVLFIIVKAMNTIREKTKKEEEEAPKEDSDEVKLLKEIRDSLKKGNK